MQSRADFFRQKYDFIPHDYGPYSPDLQYDIDELIEKKLIDDELQTTDHGKIKYRYKITGEGTGILAEIMSDKNLDKKFQLSRVAKLADDVKREVNDKDLRSLLSEIYGKYPEFAKYSKYRF